MKNKAAYCTGLEKMEIDDAPMPVCGDEDVLIEIAYCGVCGSDAHWYANGEAGFEDVYPYILGHEFTGVVIETGSEVSNLKIGDRVVVEPGKTCGKCKWCKEGRYNLCPDIRFLSAPREQGAMQKYVAHPASLCYKLPENVSLKTGALIEPFAVGLHAVETAEVTPGKTVAILGCGCIGLCVLMASKLYHAAKVIMLDVFEEKLQTALAFGADAVIHSKNEDAAARVMELTDGMGADIVFEAAGTPVTTAMTEKLVMRGGVITLIGCTHGETPFEFYHIIEKEVAIKPIFRYRNNYQTAIKALEGGRVELDRLITGEYTLEQAKEAFDTALYGKQDNIKVMVKIKDE